MAVLFEGEVRGKAANAEIGYDNKGKARVRWDMLVTDGEHKGKRAQYGGKLDDESIKFTKQDMMRIGWAGKDVRTFVDDVKRADLTVPFTAEIATTTYADSGKTSSWTAVRFGGQRPLETPTKEQTDKMNHWFAQAADDELPPGLR